MARHRALRHCPCGTRLASDHRGVRCAACEHQEHDRRAAPPQVPPDFWTSPQFDEAFATQHIGRVARVYRKHPLHATRHGREGISQELLGSWLGLTQAQVSRIENGPPIRNLDTLAHWSNVLTIPEDRLWFRLPQRPAPRISSVAASASPPVPGPETAAIQAFRAADVRVGGGHLYATVTQYLTTEVAPRLLSTEPDGQSVFAGAAALTEMAGWMAHDAGRDLLAQRHFARASDLVRVSDDRQLSAHIMASRSHLAHHLRQPAEAVQLARTGHQLLERRERNPALAARLMTMAARGHAAMRQPAETRAQLDRAEATFAQPPSEPASPWINAFDEGALASEAARCMQELGDRAEVRRRAERIVALRGPDRTRSRAFGQLMLTGLLIADHQPDTACQLANEVLEATQSLGSYLVFQQLIALRHELRPYRLNHRVAEFLDRLEDAMNERLWLYRWMSKQHGHAAEQARP
jgi:hypothetical protein